MTTRSYAHVGCATVLLGGAGLLFLAGGLEALQQGAPLGWLAIGGGCDVPPILSSAAIWSSIPNETEIGHEEALFRRADHWLPA